MKLDTTSGDLTLVQSIDGGPNPSFLVVSPDHRFLYSADEGSSEIAAFAIDPKTAMLTPLNRASAVGQGPAHVAIDATGKLVFGVNYGSGDVTMLPVNADGSLGMSLTNFATGANAHQLVIDSMNHFAFVPNKGSDSVSLLVLDANAKTLTKKGDAATFKQGSGPRHIALDPKGPFAFVMHELSSEIAALKLDPATGAMTLLATMSSLPMGFSGNNTGAEIAFGHDAKFLYASNRGHDSIAIVSVDHATGAMTLVGHQPTGGSTPRHFSIEPAGNVMLVGNQGSNSITTFRIEADGKLTPLATTTLPSGPEFVGVSYF
jgi:6-phosphogluconolactonase